MKYTYKKHSKQKGLTLVELLVASFLGVMLVGVVGSMYFTSTRNFKSTNELSKVQENTRFALHFIQEAVAEAGYSLCGNNVARDYSYLENDYDATLKGGLYGWNYAGTNADGVSYDLTYVDVNDATGAEIALARDSNAASPVDLISTIDVGTGLTGGVIPIVDFVALYQPLKGSDILAVTIEQEQDTIEIVSTDSDLITVDPDSSVLPQRAIIKVGDCYERNIFSKTNLSTNAGIQAAATDGNIADRGVYNKTAGLEFSKYWGPVDEVYNDVTTVFYVGTGASGLPALFRTVSPCGFEFVNCEEGFVDSVELVEGVENMQVLYGVDTSVDGDGVADRYYSADELPDLANTSFDIVNLRIALLMVGEEPTQEIYQDEHTLLNKIVIDTSTAPDRRLYRYVINSTIEIRNRLDQ